MLDYEYAKRFYATKLAEDVAGHGRMESALYHTVRYAYERGLAETPARCDDVYEERNRCVALIAGMAIAMGYCAGIAKTAIPDWDPAWHNCVYIDLPTGQVSWHYHDREAHLFNHLPPYGGQWDGHDTSEKYRRAALASMRLTNGQHEVDE